MSEKPLETRTSSVPRLSYVEYCCFTNNTGFGHAALGYIRALHRQGFFVKVKPLHGACDHSWMDSYTRAILARRFSFDPEVAIWHSIPARWNNLKKGLKKTILVCTFECDDPPIPWVDSINQFGDVILYPSNYCKFQFEKAGCNKPGFVIPHCVDDSYFNAPSICHIGGETKFISIGTWKQRKNWPALISAFASLIGEGLNIKLLIKTDNAKLARHDVSRLVRKEIYHKFEIVDGNLSNQSLASLMSSCHAYICASRGEGFCLPVAQAMSMGLPVISTNIGGLYDFVKEENAIIIESGPKESCPMDGYPQFHMKNWPIVSEEAIRRAVRQACENYSSVIADQAKVGKTTAKNLFSLNSVGAAMKEMVIG